MEESAGNASSLPSEVASSSAASASPVLSDSLSYPTSQSQLEMYPGNPGHVEAVEVPSGERVIPLSELKAMLRQQLEYYFSRENLSTDAYLISQMDSDNFVPIKTIAKFNQIRRLTEDVGLVVEVLRESAVVQVDEAGEKVRPNPRSGVLILREIPESTPIKELEELFSSENCPKFSRCEFAHNNSWYVLFDTDEDTQKAYRYLREEAKTFNGKPIMARIKAKAITSAPFTPSYKNGACSNTPEQETYGSQNISQQQPQPPVQYTYANVPSEGYSNQQVCPPFYPPTMLQAWAPTTPTCVDLGTVLSVNGLSPQAAFRPLNSNSNRHSFSSRDRPVKTYAPQNYNFQRSEQNRYYNNRGQSVSYMPRQQQQQPSFHNIVNTNFEYMPYSTRSRNLHNFGVDMNFFAAPNLYYSKVPSLYQTHTSQTRHNPVIVSRSQVGLGAINNQDQSYLVGNSTVLPIAKDNVLNVIAGVPKQSADSQVKENWGPNQRQRGKRWWKENGSTGSSKSYSDNSNGVFSNKSQSESDAKPESPKFDLETASFPPLPGCLGTDVIDVDVYESRLSDIVKGVKPTTRDSKTQTSESALTCSTKDSSTITIEDAIVVSDGAFNPSVLPETLLPCESEPVDDCEDINEWDDESFAKSSNDSILCSTSISNIATAPVLYANAALSPVSSPSIHTAATNSFLNGNVTANETTNSSAMTEPELIANVPSEIETKPVALKLPKAKQLDGLPKSRPCDIPSPKNKTPDSTSSKNKFDVFKDRATVVSKHKPSFSNSRAAESSLNKERGSEVVSAKTDENNISSPKSIDAFSMKEKPMQSHMKGRASDSNISKARAQEVDFSLSVNGHADSESTVSSEDEKASRRPTYSEVAMRAKDKVEKIAQELKEKEAMVRHHRPNETVIQQNKPVPRGPLRELPRGRPIEPRPGPKEWRERRKPARTISLPSPGQ